MATINEIITEVDEIKPNAYDEGIKIKWLSNLDYRIYNDIIKTHEQDEDNEITSFAGYDESNEDTELLAPDPYSELYKYYLYSMIDFSNSETDRYANSMQMFNTAYSDYQNHYNRTHLPIGQALKL